MFFVGIILIFDFFKNFGGCCPNFFFLDLNIFLHEQRNILNSLSSGIFIGYCLQQLSYWFLIKKKLNGITLPFFNIWIWIFGREQRNIPSNLFSRIFHKIFFCWSYINFLFLKFRMEFSIFLFLDLNTFLRVKKNISLDSSSRILEPKIFYRSYNNFLFEKKF